MKKLKKILYKVTAFHCQRCGGITEPAKKYCEYCERELKAKNLFNPRILNMRVLIEGKNGLVNFNDISSINTETTRNNIIDCTMLEDNRRHYMSGIRDNTRFEFDIFATERGNELYTLLRNDLCKTRVEVVNGNFEQAFEMTSYIGNVYTEIEATKLCKHRISLNVVDDLKRFNSFIPSDVLDVLRCPNCGAPIKSSLGACDFCGGWVAVSW